ncbi:MAG: hypothetical protein HC901_00795 [Bdellovibrionaceae bacterium]|nr:hypothetical protein [Pseudobdellovibrionaceae bacterium]
MLVLAVLVIMATAFMQSMRIDRLTARAYLNKVRAEMAAEAARALATQGMTTADFRTDDFSILRLELETENGLAPYAFLAKAEDATTSSPILLYPLLSTNRTTPITIDRSTFDNINRSILKSDVANKLFDESFNPNDPSQTALLPLNDALGRMEDGSQSRQIAIPWVTINDSSGKPRMRFAYWIEDLQGYIDLQQAGNVDDSTSNPARHRRGEFQPIGGNATNRFGHPADIGLFTWFDSTLPVDQGSESYNNLIEVRNQLPSAPSARQLGLSGPNTGQVRQISRTKREQRDADPWYFTVAGLGHEMEPELIPDGFGFVNAGQPKVNLNNAIQLSLTDPAGAVANITQTISSNLPNFADARCGGMNATDYLQNLAANIIDYADADSSPTTNGSTYRGIDSYPFISQYYMLTLYKRIGSTAEFTVEHYLELWNLSDKPFQGRVRFVPTNNYTCSVSGTAFSFSDPRFQGRRPPPLEAPVSLAGRGAGSNQKAVVLVGTTTHTVTGAAIPADPLQLNEHYNSSYQMYVDDGSGKGMLLADRGQMIYRTGRPLPNTNGVINSSAGLERLNPRTDLPRRSRWQFPKRQPGRSPRQFLHYRTTGC